MTGVVAGDEYCPNVETHGGHVWRREEENLSWFCPGVAGVIDITQAARVEIIYGDDSMDIKVYDVNNEVVWSFDG